MTSGSVLRLLLTAMVAAVFPLAMAHAEEFFPLTTPVELATGQPDVEVGELIFRGGVAIEPDKAKIGGISSLEWWDGKLYAVMDDGRWLVMTPSEVNSRLVDVSAMEVGPLLDRDGRRLRGSELVDAEAITRTAEGEWLIAFERENRIWHLVRPDQTPEAHPVDIAPLLAGSAFNKQIETLAAYPGGLLVCGEWIDAARPNCLRETAAGAVRFQLPAPAGIAEAGGVPTDAACKADGTCFVLFRSFSAGENRAAIVELAPDNTVRMLAVLAPPLELDNFEGLAVREDRGRIWLYLVSDDNFGNCAVKAPPCQRSLLMKFEIKGPPSPESALVAATPPGPVRAATRPASTAPTVAVVLETELGAITVALETQRAPITAGNFLRYVDEKRFDGTVFYRAMRLERDPQPNGLIQGGTQFDPRRILPPIAHEPTTLTGLTHTHGALSMAMGEPGSANGDFSIMIEDQTGLDADPASTDPVWRNGYAVFGYVTAGMDVVAAIHASPIDPDKGEGWMKGEILARPVTILKARRAVPPPPPQ